MKARELVDRLAASGQDAVNQVSNELMSNPVTAAAIARAGEAKSRMDQASTGALNALNLPSATDLEEVSSRVRAIATRAERMESTLASLLERLDRIEAKLDGQAPPVAPSVGQTTMADPLVAPRDL
jgi:hypothetical protein